MNIELIIRHIGRVCARGHSATAATKTNLENVLQLISHKYSHK